MNYGNKRRKRYRVRYDRLIAVVLIIIVLIVLLASCSKSCSDKKAKKTDTNQSSIVDDTLSTPSGVVPNQSGQPTTDGTGNNVANTPVVSAEYTTSPVEYSMVNNGDLIVVNPQYEYKFQTNDINVVDIYSNRNDCYSVSDMNVMLDANVISSLNTMMSDYFTATGNEDLRVIGGYRTKEDQNVKYESASTTIPGGYSDYHTARSFNLGIFPKDSDSNYYSATGVYAWINDNAANYGFVVRYPDGKDSLTGDEARAYTFRYVGIPHAIYMKQNNLCLEEYIEAIKAYTYGTNTLKVTAGTAQYEVYYVAANVNNVTEVPVPSNKTYTISGNNIDGFIVTVTM